MNEQQILDELLALLEDNGVAVRHEQLDGGGGGLCTIQGKHTFFLDTQASTALSCKLCAEAVGKIVDIEDVYITPQVRMLIEQYSNIKEQ